MYARRSFLMKLTPTLVSLLAFAALGVLADDVNSTVGILGSVDLGDWASAYAKAKAAIANLTNDEKITIITGGNAGNWTALVMTDGSQGIESDYYVSAFAQASAISFTWDKNLAKEQANAVATEHFLKGSQLINGPTSEPLGRTPWGGRSGETFGPDPYLNGIIFGISTKAYKGVGIIPGGKHFLLNEQETNRTTIAIAGSTTSESYSSNADDKTIHETYLWPFYDGVKSGLGAVMCAMSQVNSSYSCESSLLLNELLKTELGFPGMVYPDVSGQHTALGSANGGLDYSSGGYSTQFWTNATLEGAIANGTFTQERLDSMVIRNMIAYYYVNLDASGQAAKVAATTYKSVRGNHRDIIRTVGAASIVLLKNTNNTLPLSEPKSVSVFGAHAGAPMAGPNSAFTVTGSGPTYPGHLVTGTGSGSGSVPYVVTPISALTTQAIEDYTQIRSILNDTYTTKDNSNPALHAFTAAGTTSVVPSIPNYAADSEVCLVFLNALAGEGADRTELYNKDQDTLVTTVAASCNNTVVVINTIGARLVDNWIENVNVTGVLYSSLLGQESGNSIADVLYGAVNPSARLPYTIAKNESDYSVGICYTQQCNFTEGVYIDYKYFDAHNVTPRYEFGYGLSYTTFKYGKLSVSATNHKALSSKYPTGKLTVGGYADLWDEVVSATVSVANSGHVDGNEVAQLYVTFPAEADQPITQLRGFERVYIKKGSSTEITFSLRRRDLSYWDVVAQKWAIASGKYTFYAGASSRDFRVSATLTI
ncbi:glycoside hydrolase family 3 protein [Plicaturopsis crispa FD-325 SS-3]|nr:glycoside hydrolase family 3 protein [Plicaturopsis crispa FD-325 SS-3]